MKYVIVLAGGLADSPAEELDGATPLEVAHTPVLDEMARRGKLGQITTLPEDLPATEEVALLSTLAYDPHHHFTGEAALAAALLPPLREGQVAFVHNLVTVADGFIRDHAAGHIPPPEAAQLLTSLARALDDDRIQFSVGAGFTGITLIPLPVIPPKLSPPDTLWTRPVEKALPKGEAAAPLRNIINLAREIFPEHDINRVRADLGENPANLIWLWGPGRPQPLPPFKSRHHLDAALIAPSESARGLATLADIALLDSPSAPNGYDLDYHAAAQNTVDALARYDLVILHTVAATEASLEGDLQRKIGVIHQLDTQLLAPLLRHASENEFVRLLVLPTHTVSAVQRTRLRAPVPAVMFGPGLEPVSRCTFTEKNAARGELIIPHGHELLAYFLRT